MGGNSRYPSSKGPDNNRRHCWVLGNQQQRGPWPGLILQWERMPNWSWRALVVYSPNDKRPESVLEWFPQDWLRPVLDAEPPS